MRTNALKSYQSVLGEVPLKPVPVRQVSRETRFYHQFLIILTSICFFLDTLKRHYSERVANSIYQTYTHIVLFAMGHSIGKRDNTTFEYDYYHYPSDF